MSSRVPTSTYRLQLHEGFTFDDVAALAGYLDRLGVSHAYLSPVLQAVPGSAHGYDVIDHTRFSDDLGGGIGFARMTDALRQRGLRAVADVVPNHMAVPVPASLNTALWAVLREGPDSPFTAWFDIDWTGQHKLLMPVLGQRLDACLDAGEITLDHGGEEPVVRYFEHAWPVRAGTAELPLEDLLEAQHYRPAWWRVGDEELNYRRFFDVDSLAGLRMEDPAVFAQTTAVLALAVREGRLAGLRIDHPDGLADPRGYLRRLAEATGGVWVVVEKILQDDEGLPTDWPCAGTTGYDALNQVLGLLVDPTGERPLTDLYTELTGEPSTFAPVLERAKRDVITRQLAAEVTRLVDLAHAICQRELRLRDHTRRGLEQALVELLVAFPRYRAYVGPGEPVPTESARVVREAAAVARARLPEDRHGDLDVLVDLVLGDPPGRLPRDRPVEEFCVRFQQTCGPVMAKGVEDTAFYRWFRLAALNEVGGSPGRFGVDVESFHAFCARLSDTWPDTMTTLSTHDTKRSEDVRARLAVLSELPGEWATALAGWRAAAAGYRSPDGPDANTEYLFWQSLLGVLPADPATPLDPARLTGYLRKATREAKRTTSWVDPDGRFEAALDRFTEAVLADEALLAQVRVFLRRVAPHAAANTLAQKLVQLTMPGVPDVYQGCEVEDLSLVDPDNRRPVDYALRVRLLDQVDALASSAPGAAPLPTIDGVGFAVPVDLDLAKLLVVSRALRLRRAHPDWFGAGAGYAPAPVDGPHALAFTRAGRVAVVAARLTVGVSRAGGYGPARVRLPGGRWRDALTGRTVAAGEAGVPLADVLAALPVALLVREPAG